MKKNDKAPIVCGTDFSKTATEAVDIAAALALPGKHSPDRKQTRPSVLPLKQEGKSSG